MALKFSTHSNNVFSLEEHHFIYFFIYRSQCMILKSMFFFFKRLNELYSKHFEIM